MGTLHSRTHIHPFECDHHFSPSKQKVTPLPTESERNQTNPSEHQPHAHSPCLHFPMRASSQILNGVGSAVRGFFRPKPRNQGPAQAQLTSRPSHYSRAVTSSSDAFAALNVCFSSNPQDWHQPTGAQRQDEAEGHHVAGSSRLQQLLAVDPVSLFAHAPCYACAQPLCALPAHCLLTSPTFLCLFRFRCCRAQTSP